MSKRGPKGLRSLLDIPSVREAAAALISTIEHESAQIALPADRYDKAVNALERLRGRPLVYPYLAVGRGQGARVWLADGTMKLDFISGIGVYAFGHGDEDLLQTAVVAAASDVVHQGHLLPGPEYLRVSRALARHGGRKLRHVWLSISGAMANENALKMILQKKAPADRIVVFERAFHGRTMAMAEMSDRPAYRDGLPLRGNVLHVPFYDADDPDTTQKSVEALDAHLKRYPGQVAGMCFELVQGEGGFNTAPREFFAALMEHCRKHDVAVWVDEVQSFGRTGELFAFRTLGLEDYVDLAVAGKMLQGSAVLFSKAYNPKPGLIAGTYAGSSVGMAVGARIIERLEDDGYLGPDGRVALLGRRIAKRFEALRKQIPRAVGPVSGIGAMQAFVPFDGSAETVKAVLHKCFDEGLILLSAGGVNGLPSKVRFLPPLNASDEELEAAFSMLEKALVAVGEERSFL